MGRGPSGPPSLGVDLLAHVTLRRAQRCPVIRVLFRTSVTDAEDWIVVGTLEIRGQSLECHCVRLAATGDRLRWTTAPAPAAAFLEVNVISGRHAHPGAMS